MKRSTCASGSGYVPSVSIGFCVAITRKGSGTLCVTPAIVTWRSCITSSSALCTFAGARLISSAGSRLVVNCTRRNEPLTARAKVLTVSVFARPGTPSTSRCPCARIATSTRSRKWSWPTTTRFTSNSTRSMSAALSLACRVLSCMGRLLCCRSPRRSERRHPDRAAGGLHRGGEADAEEGSRCGVEDRARHPDHLAVERHQRPAGASRIDRGVELDQPLEQRAAILGAELAVEP